MYICFFNMITAIDNQQVMGDRITN